MSIRKNSTIALIAVLGSRVLGLVREIIFASFFGAGFVLDAFIAAFRIPNLLRDLFAEGALSQAFVTVFSKTSSKDGDKSSFELANHIFGFLIVTVGILAILGIIFSPLIVKLVAPGFEGDKLILTTKLNQILFPFILLVSLASVAMGMLNTKGKFALPQSASTFFNLTSITCGLLFSYLFDPEYIQKIFTHLFSYDYSLNFENLNPNQAILGMAWGTLLGGFVQWFIQMPSLFKMGFKFKPKFNFKHPGLKKVLKLTGPAIIGGAAVQVNVLVNTNFASFLEDGSISWLSFAFRLMQFPLGVFGVSIAIASTPVLAKLLSENKLKDFKNSITQSIQYSLFLCIPAGLGLAIFAEPIISLVFEYGKFNSFDTLQTSYALQAYLVSLPFYALIKIYQPAFLAFNDAKTPMKISLSSIIINLGVNAFIVFVLEYRHWGLALGTSTVAIYNFILLTIIFRKNLKNIWDKNLVIHLLKIILASILSVGISYLVYSFFLNHLSLTFYNKILIVIAVITMTSISYLFFSLIFRVEELSLLKNRLMRKK